MARYVLVTAARNEADYIEKTLQSVVSQTVRPVRWVIVSDGSTDRTEAIVDVYREHHDFIELVRTPGDRQRNFASKVFAFQAGYACLEGVDYGFLGNLDADVSFGTRYYETVLEKFCQNERLGVAGGIRYDRYPEGFRRITCACTSVGGPYQLFRRSCFEAFGGFLPLENGGEDAVAEIMARMHGWVVACFEDEELQVRHYRVTGTASGNALKARYQFGVRCFSIGYHPLFMTARCLYRIKEDQPFLLGSLLVLAGYLGAMIRRCDRQVPREFLDYFRAEQLIRLNPLASRNGRTAPRGGPRAVPPSRKGETL